MPAQSHPPAGVNQMFAGVRILVAEDNLVNQKLALRLLQRMGADVTLAGNGVEALAALREADFDAVADRFVAAAKAMRRDAWWWSNPELTNKSIRRAILKETIARRLFS